LPLGRSRLCMFPALGPVSPSSMALWSCILQWRSPELRFGDDPCRWGEVAFACLLRWVQGLHCLFSVVKECHDDQAPSPFLCGISFAACLGFPRFHVRPQISRVGQNRIFTPYMNVYFGICRPKITYKPRTYMVLVNPIHKHTWTVATHTLFCSFPF